VSRVRVMGRSESDGTLTLLAYREDGRSIPARICEEIGEDHGFFDPQTQTLHGAEHPNTQIITEGYTGALCEHRWDSVMHFSRNPYGYIRTCGKCGVKTMESHRKRSNKGTYTYDVWELREHIWRKWMQTGPVPGALQPQAHHKGGEAE